MKEGYKQTEVGVIPEDWEVVPLPDAVWFQEGPGLRNWQFTKSGLKVINITNLQDDGFLNLDKTDRHISWDEFEKMYKHFLIDENDFVMASSGNSYCKTSTVRQSDLPLLMNTSVIRFKALKKTNKEYMEAYLKSYFFKKQIDLLITGGAQPNFGPAHLKLIKFPLPPSKLEQKAIAKALSDMDALIQSLEQLIAKKRQIKQGAMQSLLSGKQRLSGFDNTSAYKPSEVGEIPKDWAVDLIKNHCSIKTGEKNTQDKLSDGVFPFFVRSQKVEKINSYSFDGEAVLTAGDGVGTGKIFHYINGKFDYHQRVYKMSNFSDNLDGYYFYLYFSTHFYDRISQMTAKSSVDSVRLEMIANMPIALPPTKAEQKAIGKTLKDMDAEITELESKFTKYQSIKQGMMQNLLTGNIRLI